MANAIIQPQAIRLNGNLAGTAKGSSTDYTSNDTRQKGLTGTLGHSDGIPDADFEITKIEVTGDTTTDQIIDALANKLPIEVEATVGSRVLVSTCRCISFSLKSESETGTIEGTIKLESSGNPQWL
jgi:hypothetical protein